MPGAFLAAELKANARVNDTVESRRNPRLAGHALKPPWNRGLWPGFLDTCTTESLYYRVGSCRPCLEQWVALVSPSVQPNVELWVSAGHVWSRFVQAMSVLQNPVQPNDFSQILQIADTPNVIPMVTSRVHLYRIEVPQVNPIQNKSLPPPPPECPLARYA